MPKILDSSSSTKSIAISQLATTISHMGSIVFACLSLAALSTPASAQSESDDAVVEQTARPTVASALDGFDQNETQRARQDLSLPSLLSGGETTIWWSLNLPQVLPTAVVPRIAPTRPLTEKTLASIGNIEAPTSYGQMTLNEFLADPRSGAQGFVIIHEGQIVFEKYPGMRSSDSHLWASVGKSAAALAIELLVDDGLLDDTQPIGKYVPELQDTAWSDIPIVDILDMATGLNIAENQDTRKDPNSIAIRTYKADLGAAHEGRVENLLDVLRDAEPQMAPGQQFDYSSTATQALVYLVEAVSGETWSSFLGNRVWSKIYADGPLLVNLTPDGVALAHGVLSSRLIDLGRFGMLYTPSWSKAANEQVVTSEAIGRIRSGVRSEEFYMSGSNGPIMRNWLGAAGLLTNSRQWDAVWNDGDFFKGGMFGQGLYVSPDRDLVIAYFSTTTDQSIMRFLRPIAISAHFAPE